MFQQRAVYEDVLKLAASQLSNKTEADSLVKLLRICGFIGQDQMTAKLLEYLKPKLNNLGNNDLS